MINSKQISNIAMKVYAQRESKLQEVEKINTLSDEFQWVDLLSPTEEEKKIVETTLGIKLPTREEAKEIEPSARFYKDLGALFMSITTINKEEESSSYARAHLTFILKGNTLVTMSYHEITSFVPKNHAIANAGDLLLTMLETIVYALADTIENLSATVEQLARRIFMEKKRKKSELPRLFLSTGLAGSSIALLRDSLESIGLALGFLKFNLGAYTNRLESLILDTTDLKGHLTFLESKTNFNLDACLGSIQIEQNNIIKIFSILAVVLLPPTLIASIYGMNFKMMPELNWEYGYFLALILMLVSAVLPYVYFKKKGWF